MKTTIACLHAHHSNIAYIEQAAASADVELVHYVDPGLMRQIGSDPSFGEEQAKVKVAEQIRWMLQMNPNKLLITCTNYIALLDEKRLDTQVPILKIDEPFFEEILAHNGQQLLLFTNPATVEGTMARLHRYAAQQGVAVGGVESAVIANTFELIMQGKQAAYTREVADYIVRLQANNPDLKLSVAQLSMVEAAEHARRQSGAAIGNPLTPLTKYLVEGPATSPRDGTMER
ncbi:hypothetical protein [Paenibacillus whitsoniae]|uniref:Asp/Glu racemase n=1 Tax=Paenibacillus whitsoniae TaxID=2496558 RepID=A0A3S0BGZ5_9BACL|nr:hypothetical protein [Paenibacillus whitsoniae]RTE02991.1 hypothetical protein EJQ19_28555 [Paenibacillus whitsoniae]